MSASENVKEMIDDTISNNRIKIKPIGAQITRRRNSTIQEESVKKSIAKFRRITTQRVNAIKIPVGKESKDSKNVSSKITVKRYPKQLNSEDNDWKRNLVNGNSDVCSDGSLMTGDNRVMKCLSNKSDILTSSDESSSSDESYDLSDDELIEESSSLSNDEDHPIRNKSFKMPVKVVRNFNQNNTIIKNTKKPSILEPSAVSKTKQTMGVVRKTTFGEYLEEIIKSKPGIEKKLAIPRNDLHSGQYLGIQPAVKFKCYKCGENNFLSIGVLQQHIARCSGSAYSTNSNSKPESSRTMCITRKVFLCSVCRTYYQTWDLYVHMRDVHKRQICLYCLNMFSGSNELWDHLSTCHKLEINKYSTVNQLKLAFKDSFFLCCCKCEKLFTEDDNFLKHKCVPFKHDSYCNLCLSMNFHLAVCPTMTTQRNIKKSITPDSSNNQNSFSVSEDDDYDISHVASFCHVALGDEAVQQKSSNAIMERLNVLENPNSFQEKKQNATDIQNSENKKYSPSEKKLPAPKNVEPKNNVLPILSSKNKVNLKRPNIQVNKTVQIFKRKPDDTNDKSHLGNKLLHYIDKVTTYDITTYDDTNPIYSIKNVTEYSNMSSDKEISSVKDTDSFKKIGSIKKAGSLKEVNSVKETDSIKEDTVRQKNDEPKPVPISTDNSFPKKSNLAKLFEHVPNIIKRANNSIKKDKSMPNSYSVKKDKSVLDSNSCKKGESVFDSGSFKKGESVLDSSSCKKSESVLDSEQKQLLSPDDNNIENNTEEVKNIIADASDKIDGQQKESFTDTSSHKTDDNLKQNDESTNHSFDTNVNHSFDVNENNSLDANENHLSIISEENNELLGEEQQSATEDDEKDETPAMALMLDDKVDVLPLHTIIKECIRTACSACLYCCNAMNIAVNGRQLVSHLLENHKFLPTKNNTWQDVVSRLKGGMPDLESVYFNTDSYDSSNASCHVPFNHIFACFQCHYVSKIQKELYLHKRKVHLKNIFICIMCKCNFGSYSELFCHLCPGIYSSHSYFLEYRCCFCGMGKIPSSFRLMVHLRKVHHTCDICLEPNEDQQKLHSHLSKHKIHHLCYKCGIAYRNKVDINKHLFWKHGTEGILCKKCLQKKWPYIYHFCTTLPVYSCEECNINFSKPVALTVHKRLHLNEYPFPCDQCNEKFISKKLLAKHVTSHTRKLESTISNEKSHIETNEEDNKSDTKIQNQDGKIENDENVKRKKKKKAKRKPIVDVYDLPPLNLSSESDDSEESVKPSQFCDESKHNNDNPNDSAKSNNVNNNTDNIGHKNTNNNYNLISDVDKNTNNGTNQTNDNKNTNNDKNQTNATDKDINNDNETNNVCKDINNDSNQSNDIDKDTNNDSNQTNDIDKDTNNDSNQTNDIDKDINSDSKQINDVDRDTNNDNQTNDVDKDTNNDSNQTNYVDKAINNDSYQTNNVDKGTNNDNRLTNVDKDTNNDNQTNVDNKNTNNDNNRTNDVDKDYQSYGKNANNELNNASDKNYDDISQQLSILKSESLEKQSSELEDNKLLQLQEMELSQPLKMEPTVEKCPPSPPILNFDYIALEHDYCIPESIFKTQELNELSPKMAPKKYKKNAENGSTPCKQKHRSKRKKNVTSSSSSSSDSDSSSSCGSNCCCSHSSSSSSSSSDSACSTPEKSKHNQIKKKKAKKGKEKKKGRDENMDADLKNVSQPEENRIVMYSKSIRESDLDTDISSTEEEFYSQRPLIMPQFANLPSTNESCSMGENNTSIPNSASRKKKSKQRDRHLKNKNTPKKKKTSPTSFDRTHNDSVATEISYKAHNFSAAQEATINRGLLVNNTPYKMELDTVKSQPISENVNFKSDRENGRQSKRKRTKNKFYGYSSGEEESPTSYPNKVKKLTIKPIPVKPNESSTVMKSASPIRPLLISPQLQRPTSPMQQTFSPMHQKIPSPLLQRARSPLLQRTPSPLYQGIHSPVHQKSMSPVHQRMNLPLQHRMPSPVHQGLPFSLPQLARPLGHTGIRILPPVNKKSPVNVNSNSTVKDVIPKQNDIAKKVNPLYINVNRGVSNTPTVSSSPNIIGSTSYQGASNFTIAMGRIASGVKNDKNDNLYCYCQCPYDEVSEMIACDGPDCKIEWFHFECVGIMVPPKGKWFCPSCRKGKDSKYS